MYLLRHNTTTSSNTSNTTTTAPTSTSNTIPHKNASIYHNITDIDDIIELLDLPTQLHTDQQLSSVSVDSSSIGEGYRERAYSSDSSNSVLSTNVGGSSSGIGSNVNSSTTINTNTSAVTTSGSTTTNINTIAKPPLPPTSTTCLLYTSDAADE